MARAEERDLPPQLTELFHRYVRARDGGRAIDLEQLLAEAGDGREALSARIRRYDVLEQAAALAGRADRGTPSAGEALGRFELIRSLGSGGLSEVFLARDPKLGREVAVKVLDRKAALDDEARTWILREARSLARIEHANVLRIFEVTEEDGAMLVVSEHLSGPSLAEVIGEMRRLEDGGPVRSFADAAQERRRAQAAQLGERLLPFTARASVLADLADALATCHDNGILHRDVKPANVVFDARGAPKLIDFGLAHLNDAEEDTNLDITERMMGTAAYLAPEQVDQERTGADPRSDQFSLGTVAYELLTLQHPFHRPTRSATFDAISVARPKPPRKLDPAIPADLERVVLHALERAPEDRYPAVAALASDLHACAEHRRVSVAEASLVHLLRLWVRRNRRLAVGAVVAATLLATALFGSWLSMARADRRAIEASLARIESANVAATANALGALDAVAAVRSSSERFDAGPLRRVVLGAMRPRVEAAMDRLSHRLAGVLDGLLGPERTDERTMYQSWSRIVDYEERLNPDCDAMERFRGLGKVQFPDEALLGVTGELFRWIRSADKDEAYEKFRLLVRIGLRDVLDENRRALLDPGRYRYVAWESGTERVAIERDFLVLPGWDELVRIEPTPRSVDESDLYRLGATELETHRFFGRPPPGLDRARILVPGFALTRRAFTRGEYAAYLRSQGREPSSLSLVEPPDLPVRLGQPEAAQICASIGGRLPTMLELRVLDDRFGAEWRAAPNIYAEWISDSHSVTSSTDATRLDYQLFDTSANKPPFTWGGSVSTDLIDNLVLRVEQQDAPSLDLGVAFRIAFTEDSPNSLASAGRFSTE